MALCHRHPAWGGANSTINERGLAWWRNGTRMPSNTGHIVAPSYHPHGTMAPVYARNHVDFQDYITWRHNVGPGGTSALTFAGHIQLTNEDYAS